VDLILMTAIGGRQMPDIISCHVSWGKRSCPKGRYGDSLCGRWTKYTTFQL